MCSKRFFITIKNGRFAVATKNKTAANGFAANTLTH